MGLRDAALDPGTTAAVYGTALRSAFDIAPSLSLLLDPSLLSSTKTDARRNSVPASTMRALRSAGLIQGTCTARPMGERRAPSCGAALPGYVVRFSPIYRMTADSLQIYVAAERYDTPASGTHPPFRFETAYQVVYRAKGWQVVRQARLPSR